MITLQWKANFKCINFVELFNVFMKRDASICLLCCQSDCQTWWTFCCHWKADAENFLNKEVLRKLYRRSKFFRGLPTSPLLPPGWNFWWKEWGVRIPPSLLGRDCCDKFADWNLVKRRSRDFSKSIHDLCHIGIVILFSISIYFCRGIRHINLF